MDDVIPVRAEWRIEIDQVNRFDFYLVPKDLQIIAVIACLQFWETSCGSVGISSEQ